MLHLLGLAELAMELLLLAVPISSSPCMLSCVDSKQYLSGKLADHSLKGV